MEGMNAEIDALINKIHKELSEMFLHNKPLVFKFERGGRSMAVIKASKVEFEVLKQNVRRAASKFMKL